MSEEWCDFTDLPKSGCEHCRPVPPPTPLRVMSVTLAKYSADCPVCGGIIAEGDPIYLTDEHETWVCIREVTP